MMARAEKLAVKYFYQGIKKEFKPRESISTSVVTQADRDIEKLFKTELKQKFPQVGFVGEETAKVNLKEYNWVIDPIDGTYNFANRVPVFAISLGLWHFNQPVYTMISLPIQKEVFYATASGGVFKNNHPIKPRRQAKLPRQLFATYTGVGANSLKLKLFEAIGQVAVFPRYYGCTVSDGVMAVMGRSHVALMVNQGIWDIGGILLLAYETDTYVEFISPPPDFSRKNIKDTEFTLVMGHKELAQKLARKIRPILAQ